MAVIDGNFVTSPIENTTMREKIRDGVLWMYAIKAVDGYVLHDKARDWYEEVDDEGNGIGEPILGYTTGTATCFADYDFTANPREFYAVPADQIFGVGNDHVTTDNKGEFYV